VKSPASGPARALSVPPVHLALALVLIVASRIVLPVWGVGQPVFLVAGVVLLLAGAALGIGARLAFRACNTTPDPAKTPSALVCSGVFRITRNPMYLGMALIAVAAALLLGQPLGLVFAAGLVWIWDRSFIVAEERVLEDVFGGEYTQYKSSVRRWI
jgi:protein-S-isoprenylcysteine O-methyltransferase Ste14